MGTLHIATGCDLDIQVSSPVHPNYRDRLLDYTPKLGEVKSI